MQYVPGEVNNSLKHKNIPVANARAAAKAVREAGKEASKCGGSAKLGGAVALIGIASTVVSLASSHQEEFAVLNKNVPLYISAVQSGGPTYDYSVEIAHAYVSIFDGNAIELSIMIGALEDK